MMYARPFQIPPPCAFLQVAIRVPVHGHGSYVQGCARVYPVCIPFQITALHVCVKKLQVLKIVLVALQMKETQR